ncbi:unnamed protein product, partial [Prunus brigantina]
MKGILGSFWFERKYFDITTCGRNFLIGPIERLSNLIPHRSIVSTKGLEEPNAKRNDKSTLIDLPNEIIFDILMRLPTKSLFDIRGLSKTSSNIVDDPFFATLHTRRLHNSATAVEAAQLMLLVQIWSFEDEKCLTALQSLEYNIDKHRLNKNEDTSTKIFSEFDYYEVDFVFCNLFCFKQFGVPSLLVNPLRGEVLELPLCELIPTDCRKWYGMGFDSITNTHKIVCIAQSAPFGYAAYVHTLGTRSSTWRQIHSIPQCEFSSKNASAYGYMHWWTYYAADLENPKHIISFNFTKDEFFWTSCPNSSQGFVCSLRAVNLLNFGGRLTILLSGDLSLEIWVLKSYEAKEWTLNYKIDNKVFTHDERGFGSIETCGAWEHGIFLTKTNPPVFYFWDARYNSIKYIKAGTLFPSIFSYDHLYYQLLKRQRRLPPMLRIFSYTRSLISLKTYGNLVKRRLSRR